MVRYPEPEEELVVRTVERERKLTVDAAAKILDAHPGPTRRVLERLADEGRIRKMMKGTRRFHFEPEVPKNFGEREDDYPDDWLAAGMGSKSNSQFIAEAADRDAEFEDEDFVQTTEDAQTFDVRIGGRFAGSISEIDLKDRVRYQITSPFEAKSFRTFSEAVKVLKKKVDGSSSL